MENYLEAMMILERPKVADEMDTTGTMDAFYMNYNIDLSPPSTGSSGYGSDDNKNYQQNSELCVAFCVSLSGMELLNGFTPSLHGIVTVYSDCNIIFETI